MPLPFLLGAALGGATGFVLGRNSLQKEIDRLKQENENLRVQLKQCQLDNATKQKLIFELKVQIDTLKSKIKEEKRKADKNEAAINQLKALVIETKAIRKDVKHTRVA